MISEEIFKAMARFRQTYKVPVARLRASGRGMGQHFEDAKPTCVYLCSKTMAHLMTELVLGDAYDLQEHGTLYGMRVQVVSRIAGVREPMPFPYIHVTGD